MTVAIGDIVRITAVVSMLGQEFVNVHHLITVANSTPDDTTFMASMQAILAGLYAHPENHQSDELRYERIEGQNVTQDVLLPQTNWTGNPTGDDLGHPLPTQVSANVFWPTLVPRVRCTTFLPGFGEAANDDEGRWTSGAQTDLQTFGDDFIGNLTFGGITVRKGAYNATLDRFTELVNAVVPSRSRTQRRRRVGVGI